MQETLRDMIELQPFEDQRELILGTDSQGQRYLHFPQFCGADVRVYRQAPVKYPKIEIKPDPFDSKRKVRTLFIIIHHLSCFQILKCTDIIPNLLQHSNARCYKIVNREREISKNKILE